MAVWVNLAISRAAASCGSPVHADVAADDRRREHLLFFFTPEYGLLEGARRLRPARTTGSAARHGARVPDGHHRVEGSRLFHDLLPCRAAVDVAASRRGAAIEGASRWYFFRRVTFPLLMPTTLFVLINAVINAFRLVDHVVVMTRGGPDNATALLLYYVYAIGFRFWDTAYAAALTMVLLALLGGAALAQFWFLERRIHYQ